MNTFKDLLDFVMSHKGTTTFTGMTEIHIMHLLDRGLKEGLLLYSLDSNDRINGMILAEYKEPDVLFVTENLAMNKVNLIKFANIARAKWPHKKLEWLKRGIHKKHNTDKIYEKLSGRTV